MTLKQFSYETFFQHRFNVSLPFFNVVSTLKHVPAGNKQINRQTDKHDQKRWPTLYNVSPGLDNHSRITKELVQHMD